MYMLSFILQNTMIMTMQIIFGYYCHLPCVYLNAPLPQNLNPYNAGRYAYNLTTLYKPRISHETNRSIIHIVTLCIYFVFLQILFDRPGLG